ncbi:MAG: glycine oxidase ThiO [Rubricoccaceae bacterium]|nr:glycine oxidase ThiO [Rubricoccaceae bacterium]
MTRAVEVVVVGAGLVGLGIAWRLVQGGHRVALYDRGAAGRGASWAAAGMLSPAVELGFEEPALYRLMVESRRRWPAFAAELERASGTPVGYDATGTLVAATDRDEVEALRRRFRFQQEEGASVEWLAGFEAAEREPLLSPRLPAAVLAPGDHQVDNRAVVEGLASVLRRDADLHEHAPVRSVVPDPEEPSVVLADGSRVPARVVVLAAGAWVREVEGLAPRPPVRPVKGQMLALRMGPSLRLRHVVRGPRAYLAPKADGRLIVGATVEEQGFDADVTGGGLYRLLEGAVELVPAVEEWAYESAWAGFRPAARDGAPLLGPVAPGVVLATGHYRHGVLLAPVTADEVAREVEALLAGSGETSPWLAPFSPARLSPD